MTIEETLAPIAPPLRMDEGGTIRVGTTRVTLDAVAWAVQQGKTAAEIARSFDTLDIADVHALISYYLRNRETVDAYLAVRECEAEELRQRIEHLCPPDELWERLRERRASSK